MLLNEMKYRNIAIAVDGFFHLVLFNRQINIAISVIYRMRKL